MNKKKIYLSLPMTVMPKDIKERYIELSEYVSKLPKYKDYIQVGPINIQSYLNIPGYKEVSMKYSTCMGKDIENVIDCDAIIMGRHWEKGPGCRLEHKAAKIYNKEIIYQLY